MALILNLRHHQIEFGIRACERIKAHPAHSGAAYWGIPMVSRG